MFAHHVYLMFALRRFDVCSPGNVRLLEKYVFLSDAKQIFFDAVSILLYHAIIFSLLLFF